MEDGGERTASRVKEAIAHASNGADETTVSDNGKRASPPCFSNSTRRTLEAEEVLVFDAGMRRIKDKHLKAVGIDLCRLL